MKKRSLKIGKRLFATAFGAMEVPLLEFYRKKSKYKGEKYFFDKIEDLNKKFKWGTRIVPIKESIKNEIKILPVEEIREIIKRSRVRTVSECWCRKTFKNCKKPINTCFSLFIAEDRLSLSDRIRDGEALNSVKSNKKELLKKNYIFSSVSEKKINRILDETEKAGLVHQLVCVGDEGNNIFYVICNCCPCCCVSLQALIKYGKQIVKESNFVAEVNEKCRACNKCISRCYFGARGISVSSGIVEINQDKCMGCGLCVSVCESKATYLVRRKDGNNT